MKFEDAVKIILEHEGGYVFNSEDPGGETKYGISKRAYPHLNIADLSIEQAKAIYKIDYWDKIRADDLPAPIRLILFDCAVNQGVERAARILQGIVGVSQDGIIGPRTLMATKEFAPGVIFRDIAKARHLHYTRLPHWATFGKGWSKRLLEIVLESVDII